MYSIYSQYICRYSNFPSFNTRPNSGDTVTIFHTMASVVEFPEMDNFQAREERARERGIEKGWRGEMMEKEEG